MRSSKKRRTKKAADRPKKRFTADLELDVYEKLSAIAGPYSLSYAMEKLIERHYSKLIKKQTAQLQESSLP